jgi:hypothetical protein
MHILQREGCRVPSLAKSWSVDEENGSHVKCNDEEQDGFLIKNQYDVGPLLELFCSYA